MKQKNLVYITKTDAKINLKILKENENNLFLHVVYMNKII